MLATAVMAARRRAAVLTCASLAGLVATGGVAYALIPDSNGVIHSCYSQAVGTWRPIDTEATPSQKCKAGETELSWNRTGRQGAPGPQGPKGDAGPQGDPGPQGPAGGADADYTGSNSHVDLPGPYTPILTLSLPAGTWSVTGTVEIGNFTGSVVPVNCTLFAPNTVGQLGQLSGTRLAAFPGGGDAITVPLMGVAQLNVPDTVQMLCQSNTGTGSIAFAEARQMTALRLSQLTVNP